MTDLDRIIAVVDTVVPEEVADAMHGSHYGIDWIYHDDRLGYLPAKPVADLAALAGAAQVGYVQPIEVDMLRRGNDTPRTRIYTVPTGAATLPLFTHAPAKAREDEYPEAAQVCAEAYQVVGNLLDDLGIFNTPEAVKILDNLSQHRMVHADVLPWVTPKTKTRDVTLEDLRELYWRGWCAASIWANRDDLISDRGSIAYQKLEDETVAPYAALATFAEGAE